MSTIPSQRDAFQKGIQLIFPRAEFSGVVTREITMPGSSAITVVYIAPLIEGGDLERLVLSPLAQGPVSGPPERLMHSGQFPAPRLRCAARTEELISGLMQGFAAIHLDGYPGVLLVGGMLQGSGRDRFGPDLDTNVAILHRQLRHPDLQTEQHCRADGSRFALIYLKARAPSGIVQAVRTWGLNLSPQVTPAQWWRSALNLFRLPPALETHAPAVVSEALSRGYVAILKDDHPDPLVAPTTLEWLFTGARDVTLVPSLRRVLTVPRLLAAMAGLTLAAGYVAISSYHHALLPGPFMVALAVGRTNLPLPVVGELLAVALISDAFQAVAARTGGARMTLLALLSIMVAFMAMMQVGVLGGMSGIVGAVDAILRATLPNVALRRVVRLWRYLFLAAAAWMGIFGMTMLLFVMMVYLAEERALEHPVRLPPTVTSQ